MPDKAMQQAPTSPPKVSELERKVRQLQEAEISIGEFKDYLKIEHAKQFDNGFKYALLNMSLHRIEHGKWQSIKKTHSYLSRAYGLTMKFDFMPKNPESKGK